MNLPYFSRHPSSQWEPLWLSQIPQIPLWIWCRPSALSSGFHVVIPASMSVAFPKLLPFSLADILGHLAIPPQALSDVSFYGQNWYAAAECLPALGNPLPTPTAEMKAEISVLIHEPVASAFPYPLTAPAAVDSQPEFEPEAEVADDPFETDLESETEPLTDSLMVQRIEAAWKSALQIERQLTGLRQKLSSIQTSLGKMDRELTADERVASDREDRDEWNDVRRWLRDLQTKCHREIKTFDVGMTSGAGVRNSLEQSFMNQIEQRKANADLFALRREFEKYRKDMASLQRSMTVTLQSASQNGTQRAQRVLGKIAGKIREMRARNREPIAGTNMHRTCRRKK